MRKPAFCICKKQRCRSAADQCLCLCYIVKSLYFLNLIFQAFSDLLCTYQFVSDLVGSFGARFSHEMAHLSVEQT